MSRRVAVAAGLLFAALLLRRPLEADPVLHVLVQMPALAAAGALLVPPPQTAGSDWNQGGIPCLLVAMSGIAFWMLPRNIDAVLLDPLWEAGKFLSLPLAVGLPLRFGWRRAHPLLRGFLAAQAISMLGVLAFLYTHTPVRLCNAYLAEDQYRLGIGFLLLAVLLAGLWVTPLLLPRTVPPPAPCRPASDGASDLTEAERAAGSDAGGRACRRLSLRPSSLVVSPPTAHRG